MGPLEFLRAWNAQRGTCVGRRALYKWLDEGLLPCEVWVERIAGKEALIHWDIDPKWVRDFVPDYNLMIGNRLLVKLLQDVKRGKTVGELRRAVRQSGAPAKVVELSLRYNTGMQYKELAELLHEAGAPGYSGDTISAMARGEVAVSREVAWALAKLCPDRVDEIRQAAAL